MVSPTSVLLRWKQHYKPDGEVVRFHVRKAGETTAKQTNATAFLVEGLVANTKYTFQVAAENKGEGAGIGDYQNITVTTAPEVKSAIIESVKVTASSSSSISATITTKGSVSTSQNFKVELSGPGATAEQAYPQTSQKTFTWNNLQPYAVYYVKVTAEGELEGVTGFTMTFPLGNILISSTN